MLSGKGMKGISVAMQKCVRDDTEFGTLTTTILYCGYTEENKRFYALPLSPLSYGKMQGPPHMKLRF